MSDKPYTMTRITTDQLDALRELSKQTGIPIIWFVTTAIRRSLLRWERDGVEVDRFREDLE